MHPVPALSEALPTHDEPRNGSNLLGSPKSESRSSPGEIGRHNGSARSASPPVRKDTISSTATNSTLATIISTGTAATAATALSIESPTNNNYSSGHAVFPVSDAENANQQQRRPSRRRTGPLSAEQREKAALIRKIKACTDCRRRRVAVSTLQTNPPSSDGFAD